MASAVQSICDQFLLGKIYSHRLDPFGICEMSIVWKGKQIKASWYSSSGDDRDVMIDGQPYPSNREGSLIIKAAKTRAKNLLNERLSELDKLAGDSN